LEGLAYVQTAGPTYSFWFGRSGWDLQICISNYFPGDAVPVLMQWTGITRRQE
jgi:hypothetical protein